MSGRKNKRWERERNLKGVGTSLGDVDGARDSRTGIIYIYEYKLIPSPRAGMVGESLAFALPFGTIWEVISHHTNVPLSQ